MMKRDLAGMPRMASALIMVTLILAACAPQAAENTAQDATEGVISENLPAAQQTQVMVTAEGETQLYADRELGFAFEYPTTWTVQGEEGASVVLVSFPLDPLGDQTAEPIPAEIPEGETRIDFAPMSEEITTLDDGIQAVRDSIVQNGQTVALDEEIRLVDNRRAYRINTQNSTGGAVTMLVTEINGRVLVITAQGNTSPLSLIEQTLRDQE
jgi:hypothetical protein